MSNFKHEAQYRGENYTDRLAKYKIMVLGAGAIGSNLTETLARTGFSKLKVLDKDRIEAHNINNQVYGLDEVGMFKTTALSNRLFSQLRLSVEAVGKELSENNVRSLLRGADLIVDAFDNAYSRKLVYDECKLRAYPCLHIGLYEGYGEVVWQEQYVLPKDPPDGDICDYALARNLVSLVVAIAAEEIVDFCLSAKPRSKSWSITLNDLKIQPR